MPVKTITVAGKAEPEYGKKRGRIKDTDGMIFQIDPMMLQQAVVGEIYNVTYKDDEFKGAKFRVVEDIVPANGAIAPPPRPAAPSQRISAPMPPTTKDEDIATLAIAKEQLRNIPPGDRAAGFSILQQSCLMWRDFKKWQKLGPQTVKEEMDDEIPY